MRGEWVTLTIIGMAFGLSGESLKNSRFLRTR